VPTRKSGAQGKLSLNNLARVKKKKQRPLQITRSTKKKKENVGPGKFRPKNPKFTIKNENPKSKNKIIVTRKVINLVGCT
jgi:hypothetical protein